MLKLPEGYEDHFELLCDQMRQYGSRNEVLANRSLIEAEHDEALLLPLNRAALMKSNKRARQMIYGQAARAMFPETEEERAARLAAKKPRPPKNLAYHETHIGKRMLDCTHDEHVLLAHQHTALAERIPKGKTARDVMSIDEINKYLRSKK